MHKLTLTFLALSAALNPIAAYSAEDSTHSMELRRVRRVLLISIDGMHALDMANFIRSNPSSTLAQLAGSGIDYTNASTTRPSDSFPSMVGIVTGGSPAVTGIYYDDAYSRRLSPPGSNCAKRGAIIDLKEGIDVNTDLKSPSCGGGIDPAKLPLDPDRGCTPVYPHHLIRVNTVFEVIRAAGMYTAYSEKRPSYDILNGPSGRGIIDLYVPEIACDDILKNVEKTKAFDDLRVTSILNEIAGSNHDGTVSAPVPAIFGMNFQAINAAKKDAPGGYQDSFSVFTPSLLDAISHTDSSIGQMVAALKARGLFNSTAIIITAKHGESALDPAHRQIVLTSVVPGIVNGVQAGLAARVTQKANSFIWLTDQTKTNEVVRALALPANQTAIGISQILSGESLKLLFPDPLTDPAVPDIIVVTNTGVNFEPSLTSTTLAEHGGFGENDTHVPLLVSIPGLKAATVRAPVQTTQIAPTILKLLWLPPEALDAVRAEGTPLLPGFDSILPFVVLAP